MAYWDYDPYDPKGGGGSDWPGTAPPPKNTLVGPYNPGAPMDPTAPVKPPPPSGPPTGTHTWDPRYDPPKPGDPGDGRVYIWMGDHWGLTEPTSTPFGPHTPQTGTQSYEGVNAPAWEFPAYESAGPFTPRNATFNFEKFAANPYTPSNWDDALKEPGYDVAQKNLLKQIEQGAANRGVLRSGKTLTDEAYGLNNFQNENFKNFDDRRFRNYQSDESNRFNAWKGNLEGDEWKFLTEYTIDKDVYGAKAQDVDRGNNYRFNASNAQRGDALSRWQSMVDSLTKLSTTYPT